MYALRVCLEYVIESPKSKLMYKHHLTSKMTFYVKLSADFLLHKKAEMKIEDYGDDARQPTILIIIIPQLKVLFIRSWSPMIFNRVFFHTKTNCFFPSVVQARRQCLNLNEEQPIWVH